MHDQWNSQGWGLQYCTVGESCCQDSSAECKHIPTFGLHLVALQNAKFAREIRTSKKVKGETSDEVRNPSKVLLWRKSAGGGDHSYPTR